MKFLLDKLSSYNLFTNFIPGYTLIIMAKMFWNIDLKDFDSLSKVILAYVLGIMVSRVGSMVVEPFAKNRYMRSEYVDFVNAEKNDSKISILLETSNMYRSLASLFFIATLVELIVLAGKHICLTILAFVILTILFFQSYVKQQDYISKRVQIFKNVHKNDYEDE